MIINPQYRFFERIQREYKAAAAHMFLLHHNVHDLLWDHRYGFLPTQHFLMEQLNTIGCDIVLGYTPSQGIIWPRVDHWQQIQRALGLEIQPTDWDGEPPSPLEPIGQFRQDGTFIAEQLGLVRIQAKMDSNRGRIYSPPKTVQIGDVNQEIQRIEIQPNDKRHIVAGKRLRFSAIAFDQAGNSIGVQNAHWKVEGNIGHISRDGIFTATKSGKGHIWVQVGNRSTKTNQIRVHPSEAIEIYLEQPPKPVEIRKPHIFSVTGRDAGGNPLKLQKSIEFEIVSPVDDNLPYHTINQHGFHRDKVHEDPLISGCLPPGKELSQQLRELFKQNDFKVGLVMYQMEKIAANADFLTFNEESRIFVDSLHQWATDLDMRLKKHIIIMAAQNLAQVHPMISNNIDIPVIEIPFPNSEERKGLINHLENLSQLKTQDQYYPDRITRQIRLADDYSHEQLARDTTGLTLFGVHDVALRAEEKDAPISPELVAEYRRQSVLMHTYGILEVMATPYDLSVVGGHPHLGPILEDIISAIHEKDQKRVPHGILLLGPSGTGKTMVAQMLARYSDLPFLRLKNPQEWTGIESVASAGDSKAYEKKLTMALNFILGMLPAIVFIDDIDQAAGPRTPMGKQQDYDGMLPAELVNLVTDSSKHGQILWVGASNRPDLLDPLFRRQGLFEERIILLRPTDGERADILRKLYHKHQIKYQDIDFDGMDEQTRKMTGGDIEQIVRRSYIFAKRDGQEIVTDEYLRQAITDFVPLYSDSINEIGGLLALREATSRSRLPPRLPHELRDFVTDEGNYLSWGIDKSRINQRLQELGVRQNMF